MSSSYHPQTDGQTKVVNHSLEQYLWCFVGDHPKKRLEWLPWAVQSSTKMTPFEVVYGIPPPSILNYVRGTSRVQAVDEYLRDRYIIRTVSQPSTSSRTDEESVRPSPT